MKAKEYFAKYGESVYREALDGKFEIGHTLFIELASEFKTISKQRNVKSNRAAVAVIKELNEKWNSLAAMFEKKYGVEVLKRNAVLNYYMEKIPELALFLRKEV